MTYRAVTNGNLVDEVPASLVEAGIYERLEDESPPPAPAETPDQPQRVANSRPRRAR